MHVQTMVNKRPECNRWTVKAAVKHVHEWTGLQLDRMANITCSAVHKSYNGLHNSNQYQCKCQPGSKEDQHSKLQHQVDQDATDFNQ